MALWEDLVIEFSQLNTNEATKRAEEFSVKEIEAIGGTDESGLPLEILAIYGSLQTSVGQKWPRILYSILGTQSWDSTSSIWDRDELVLESIKPLLASLNRVDILQHIEGELFTILEQFRGAEFKLKRYYPESIIRLVDKCLVKIAEHYLIIDVQPPPTRLMNLQSIIRFVLPIILNQLPSLSRLTQGHAHYFDLVDRLIYIEPEWHHNEPMYMRLVTRCVELISKNGSVTIKGILKKLTNSLDGYNVRIIPHIFMALYGLGQTGEERRRLMREFLDDINRLRGPDNVYVEVFKLHYYIAFKLIYLDQFFKNQLSREDIKMVYKDILSHEESEMICCAAFDFIKCIDRSSRELLTEKEMDKITMVALTTDACRAHDARCWLADHRRIPGDWSVCFSKIVDRCIMHMDRFKTSYLKKEPGNYLYQLGHMFELTNLIITLCDDTRTALADFERLLESCWSFAEFVCNHPRFILPRWIWKTFEDFIRLSIPFVPEDTGKDWQKRMNHFSHVVFARVRSIELRAALLEMPSKRWAR